MAGITSDVRRENVKEMFHRAALGRSVPYDLDVTPPTINIAEGVRNDPGFAENFQNPKSAFIVTDGDLVKLEERLEKVLADQGIDIENFENKGDIIKVGEIILTAIKEEDPKLHEYMENFTDISLSRLDKEEIISALEQELEIDISNFEEIEPLLQLSVLSETIEEGRYRAIPQNILRGKVPSAFASPRLGGAENPGGLKESIYIPDENFDFQGYLESSGVFIFHKDEIDLENVPGTSAEWGALISYHEMEHVAHDGQINLHEYESTHELGEHCRTLMAEIEADCAAFKALDGHISPEVMDYWVATRIASTITSELGPHDEGSTLASSTHSTGFHLAEFNLTGNMPDYFEMQENVNGFYGAMYDEFDQYRDGLYAETNLTTSDLKLSGNLNYALGLAIEMRDQGEFDNPAHEQLAEQFITSVRDTLGVEPSADWRADITAEAKASEPKASEPAATTIDPDETKPMTSTGAAPLTM